MNCNSEIHEALEKIRCQFRMNKLKKNSVKVKNVVGIWNLKTLMDNMFVSIKVKLMDKTPLMNLLIFMIIDVR